MEAVMVAMEEEEAMMEAMKDPVLEHVEQEPPQPREQLAVQEAKNNKYLVIFLNNKTWFCNLN
jgi:hypothetical protein